MLFGDGGGEINAKAQRGKEERKAGEGARAPRGCNHGGVAYPDGALALPRGIRVWFGVAALVVV